MKGISMKKGGSNSGGGIDFPNESQENNRSRPWSGPSYGEPAGAQKKERNETRYLARAPPLEEAISSREASLDKNWLQIDMIAPMSWIWSRQHL